MARVVAVVVKELKLDNVSPFHRPLTDENSNMSQYAENITSKRGSSEFYISLGVSYVP